MSLEYAQNCIVDIQNRIKEMSNEEIVQALEVIRESLIPVVTVWEEPERPDEPGYDELDCGLPPGSFNS